MKKILALLLALAMVLSFAACGQPADNSGGNEDENGGDAEKITIGLAMHNQTADWAVQFKDSFLEAAAAHSEVEVVWNDANSVAATQVSNIETLVAQGCSVIVVDPADYTALGQALAFAAENGVKVVNCDSKVVEEDQEFVESFITADCYTGGYTLGEYLAEKLPEGATVGFLNYPQIQVIADRFIGVVDAFNDLGRDDIVVIEKIVTDTNNIAAYTEDMLLANPEITAFVCLNDNSALTCWATCDQMGNPDCQVFGFDGSPAGKQSIENGEMTGSMVYSPVDLANYSFDAAYTIATGGAPEREVLVPMWLISPENIAERDLQNWE